MSSLIKKLLKIKAIKVILCIVENIIKHISTKLWQKIEHKLYNAYDFGKDNITHTQKLYEKIKNITDKFDFELNHKKILELWPWAFLWVGAFLKKEWISEYNIIDDINHFEKLDKKAIKLYQEIDKNILDWDSFDTTYVKQLQYNKEGLPLDGNSIDLIFSNAVYEHVDDPQSSIKELSRVTKKWWLSIHTIDFRDHIFDQKSLFFLSLPTWLFNFLFKKAGAWVNRKRYDDFINYFEQNWFEILDTDVHEYINKQKIAATFVCKKI